MSERKYSWWASFITFFFYFYTLYYKPVVLKLREQNYKYATPKY